MSDYFDDEKTLISAGEFADLERTLKRLDDQDLGEWDQDFLDDMCRRVFAHGRNTKISGRQWAQVKRMEDQYL